MPSVLRTPDERFADLPGFPFVPHYLDDLGPGGLRAHYIDEGPVYGRHVFLCLHGEPTWSYLYRRMIPVFVAAGHRVLAPDFFGFGRSDKPEDEAAHTIDLHREFLLRFVEKLDLRNVTLVLQDWGGLLGLTLPMEMPERFSRLLLMNTALGTGDVSLGDGFLAWRDHVAKTPDLACSKLLRRTCPHLTEAEAAAYDAPFPGARFKAGVRRIPQLLPDRPDAPGAELSRRAREWLRTSWQGETFMAVGAKDPVLGPKVMEWVRSFVRGCPEPWVHPEAGHFVQEWGDEVARVALKSFAL